MRFELRNNRDGTKYYSFVFYDPLTQKPHRLLKEDIRKRFGSDITELSKAIEAAKLLSAEQETMAQKIAKRVDWEKDYYNFNKLLNFYEVQQQKKAPNSYKNNIHFMRYYVLPFFLGIKKCPNISSWFSFYTEFKDWLETEARLIKNPNLPISFASKNHAIKALNTFMALLHKQGILDRFFSCESFASHLLGVKGIDDIIKTEEMESIYSELIREGFKREAIFFRFLFFTGMRFNEALGIHPGNIYDGQIEDKTLSAQLSRHHIKYFGYLVFDSQPSHKTRGLRGENGILMRKPLKGKKNIDDKSSRSIVITDKVLWNLLVALHNQSIEANSRAFFGKNIEQYPIFDGIDRTTSSNRLKAAFKKLGLRYRSWHCCRHTRATMLIGETANTLLAKLWLGHSTEKVLSRYVHIYEAVIRSAKKKGVMGGIKKLNTID